MSDSLPQPTRLTRLKLAVLSILPNRHVNNDFDIEKDRWPWFKIAVVFIVLYLLLVLFLSFLWSGAPRTFTIEQAVERYAPPSQQVVTGVVTTSSLIYVVNTLFEKPGGYLSNDVLPPGMWLDNIPSVEFGVLVQSRDMAKAMRERFSRSQSQSTEDKDLASFEAQLNFDHKSWLLPATETEYKQGVKFLMRYLSRLADEGQQNAQFYARADNLNYWLSTVETRLGSLSQRLSASVGQKRINTDLAGDSTAKQATQAPSEFAVKTPWSRIDNEFYEARGSAWALIHFLKAVEVDFADVLAKKNAKVSMQQIIRELEATQQTIYSPVILNGSGFGVLTNHSLVMASYISRANAAIIDLRELLSQG